MDEPHVEFLWEQIASSLDPVELHEEKRADGLQHKPQRHDTIRAQRWRFA